MALHKRVTTSGLYFITFTCKRWLPLIEMTNSYDLVYQWFEVMKGLGNSVTGYVILPNHLHVLLYYNGGKQSLNTIIGNGKRFMAYQMIRRLAERNERGLLTELANSVSACDRLRSKLHEVWERAFDMKKCLTDRFAFQKIQYIHNNPCKGKWNLVKSIVDYPHSSALYYISGKQGIYPVQDYREFLE